MENNSVKVMIVDGNSQRCESLTAELEKLPQIEISEAVPMSVSALRLATIGTPDVLMIDITRGTVGEVSEFIKNIKDSTPNTKILVLSLDCDRELVALLGLGAHGYCSHGADSHKLWTAIMSLDAGAFWIDHELAARPLKELFDASATASDENLAQLEAEASHTLSPREMEVLALLVEGLSNKEISQRLQIGVETTKTHLKNLMRKLKVRDRTHAVLKALRDGVVELRN